MISKAAIILWHRRLALVAGCAVILWGISGLLHPLMTWTNPRQVSFIPPAAKDLSVPPDENIGALLIRHNINQVTGLRLIGSVLQITVPDQPERLYLDLKADQLIDGADRERAIMLARHYAGLPNEKIAGAVLITAFDSRYTYINRYLPVWRVDFEDRRHLHVYVDTGTDRLGTITDRRKIILQTLFQIVHTGSWLDQWEGLRLTFTGVLVGTIILLALAGLYMLVRLRGRRKGVRKFHRILAYGALIPLMVFPVSGLFHLLVQSPLLYGDHSANVTPVGSAQLQNNLASKADDIRLVSYEGQYWWRIRQGDETTYNPIEGKGAVLHGDEAFVSSLFPSAPLSVSKVTGFSDEYGFAYKRLPVWRVDTGNELVFVESLTGVISARISPLNIAETWSFSRLHKWQSLDGIGEKIMGKGPYKNALRDGLMVFFIMLALAATVMGLILRLKSTRKD